MFINFTNHPSIKWSRDQIDKTTAKYGEIVDVPFPAMEPSFDEDTVGKMARDYVRQIIEMNPDAVLCQGEFSLTFAVVEGLKEHGIKAVTACSKRQVSEVFGDNGEVLKTAVFKFVKYREYL